MPTGNFGNVFAGYVAAGMGLPVAQIVVATNRNDILARFFEGGEMSARPVEPSLSPSMDIQVSSNFERLLFDMMGRDGGRVADAIEAFRAGGRLTVDPQRLAEMRALFDAGTLDDPGTLAEIRATWRNSGILLDPHSAVGVAVGRRRRRETDAPLVTLATAHPAKFPDAVEQATGVRPDLPERLADLFDRPERMDTVANELARVQDFVRARVSLQGAA